MKRLMALLISIAFTGCTGDTGPQGPQGPAGSPGNPYPRDASYCVQSSGVTATSNWSVAVTCTHVADIPIEGWCYASDLPAGAFLASSVPVDWPDTTKAAGWSCTWGWQGSPPGTVGFSFAGTAEICCATPQ